MTLTTTQIKVKSLQEQFHVEVNWIITQGHRHLSTLNNYAQLPEDVRLKVVNSLHQTQRNAEEVDKRYGTVVHRTALYDAKKADREDLVAKLLELGADETIDPTARFGEMVQQFQPSSVLHKEFDENSKAELVKFAQNNKVNINGTNMNGYAALHNAVYSGNADLVKTLLELGADVNVATVLIDGQGFSPITPLHCAIEHLDPTMVDLLCAHRADLMTQTRGEKYPSELAAQALESYNKLFGTFGPQCNTTTRQTKFDAIIKILRDFFDASTVSAEEMLANDIAGLNHPEVDLAGEDLLV